MAACGSTPSADGSGAARSKPFAASSPGVPAGYHLEQCQDLRTKHNRGLALRLVVPDGYDATERGGAGCGFGVDGDSFAVSFDQDEDLSAVRTRDLDPFEDVGGDDEVDHIAYRSGVPVLGERRGERLTWHAFNDGLPLDSRIVQSDGVALRWDTETDGAGPPRGARRTVGASVALVRDDRSTCRTPRGAAWFSAPVPQTESFDAYSGRCHLYLQPGRESLLRYAEVVPGPTRTAAERATRLRRDPEVASVRLEPGAGRLGGVRADRLTWVVVRTKPTEDYQPAGTWRIVSLSTPTLQASWGATPEQWRSEGPAARRFFDAVRPLR